MGSGVLIVDDHAGFRTQARRLLESEGYAVVGEAPDCATALACAREVRPWLALVDVFLPDGNGCELAAKLVALADHPAVVLTSSHDRAELEPCVAESGAAGFIPKAEISREEIEKLLS